jgi:hypothetical protein
MKLLHQALLLSLAWLFVSCAVAAQPKKMACPLLEISTSPQTVIEGDLVTLKAAVTSKSLAAKITYSWALSAGEIVSGQGTNTIQIKTDHWGGGYITATVEVKGLPASCATIKAESFAVKFGCPTFKLETPSAPVEEGQPAILTARVEGSGANRATFYWLVSAGKIRRGQATSAIEVDTSKLGGVGILAAVELGGVAPACRTNEVVAVMIAKKGSKKVKARTMAMQ